MLFFFNTRPNDTGCNVELDVSESVIFWIRTMEGAASVLLYEDLPTGLQGGFKVSFCCGDVGTIICGAGVSCEGSQLHMLENRHNHVPYSSFHAFYVFCCSAYTCEMALLFSLLF